MNGIPDSLEESAQLDGAGYTTIFLKIYSPLCKPVYATVALFVAEAFVKQGLGLFYYKKDNSTLEEDFFVRTRDELIPVEVKSNNDRSKSLATLIKNENYSDIKHGIKLGDFNIGYANNIYTFPYFCAFMIKAYLKSLD